MRETPITDAKVADLVGVHPGVQADELEELARSLERSTAVWRDFAEHLECCSECGMASVDSCPDGQPLKAAALQSAAELTALPGPGEGEMKGE